MRSFLLVAALAAATSGDGPRQSGAVHWSRAPLEAPAVPAIPDPGGGWVRGAVDAFVLAALRDRGLEPAPEADRATLLRRVTYDLHGLPPTPAEVAAFVDDPAPDAYERVVERLLASPRYAERWARHWLDEAHYADTHGYDKDKPRPHAWRYRDWVVAAIDRDLPWRDFVRAQVAGDVLDPGGPDVAATGFLAAGPWDYVGHVELREGTVEKELARSLDRDDVVRTVASAFTSTTLHCARCHEHRFDPIESADYYALQAVFAGVERADRPFDPDPGTAARRRAVEASLAEARRALEAELAADRADARLADLAARLSRAEPAVLPEALRASVAAPDGTPRLGWHSDLSSTPDVPRWVQLDLGASRSIDRVVLWPAHERFAGHPGPGFGFPPRFSVAVADDPAFAVGADEVLRVAGPDFPNPGDAPVVVPVARAGRYVRVTAHRLWERSGDFAFALAELTALDADGAALPVREVTASDSIEMGERWGRARLVDGVVGASTLAHLAARGGGDPLAAAVDLAAEVERRLGLVRAYARLEREVVGAAGRARRAELRARIDELEAARAALPAPALVYAAAATFEREGSFTPPPDGRPRPVSVLERGEVTRPLAPAVPGAFAVGALPARFALDDPGDEGARRLALANWLVDPAHPLTWRSAANRFWQHHFGRALVATPDDFGAMGEAPTHAALLDHLAARLRDGATPKELHRELVTSASYRQSSRAPAPHVERDPGNRYLSRANRRRLDAEALRDAMLAVSGELDLGAVGGAGFQAFDFEDDHSPRYLYRDRTAEDPETLRRAIYRFVVRSVPDPWFEVFDAADPSAITPARLETTTPQQMLALWHSSFALRRAEAFAARLERELPDAGTPERVVRAWWLACSRAPRPAELAACVAHADSRGLAATCRALFASNAFLYVD